MPAYIASENSRIIEFLELLKLGNLIEAFLNINLDIALFALFNIFIAGCFLYYS